MSTPVANLVLLLDLEELEVNIFRGRSPDEDRQRVFGGQVLGQALVAAGRTVGESVGNDGAQRGPSRVHSLHAYFLRPGDPLIPILYEVERSRDGRSFTTRRVVAIQHGKQIFHMETSFQREEPGLEHQAAMPDAPEPEDLPTWEELVAPHREELGPWADRERPIDMRYCDRGEFGSRDPLPPYQRIWIRADGSLPEDPVLHAAVVAYASDMSLLDTAVRPHGLIWSDGTFMMASLDHVMWFHRSFRADDWLLYEQESPAAAGSRGFSTGRLFDRSGCLVVSVAQEGLIRVISST